MIFNFFSYLALLFLFLYFLVLASLCKLLRKLRNQILRGSDTNDVCDFLGGDVIMEKGEEESFVLNHNQQRRTSLAGTKTKNPQTSLTPYHNAGILPDYPIPKTSILPSMARRS